MEVINFDKIAAHDEEDLQINLAKLSHLATIGGDQKQ